MRNSIAAAAAGLALFTAVPALAADCKSPASMTSELWKKWGETATTYASSKGSAATTAAEVAKRVDAMVKFFNEKAGNSWAKIGPRELSYSGDNNGTIQSVGDRAWVAASPLTATRTVEFKKLDGEGTAEVVICKVDKNNVASPVKAFTVDGKDKDGAAWSASVPADHFVTVIVDGKKITGKVQYRINVK